MKNRKFICIKAIVISALLLGSVPVGAFTADGFASESHDILRTTISTVTPGITQSLRDAYADMSSESKTLVGVYASCNPVATVQSLESTDRDSTASICTNDDDPADAEAGTEEADTSTATEDVAADNSPDGDHLHTVEPVTGWVLVDGDYYYFDEEQDAVTGLQLIDHYLYTFDENGVLTEGCFDVSGKGLIRYYWAGEIFNKGWLDVGGKTYYLCIDGYAYTGKSKIEIKIGAESENDDATYVYEFYLFDDNGALIDVSGLYDYKGETLYLEDGQLVYKGLVEIDGAYYYINSQYHPVTGSHYVYRTNGLVPEGYYEFDEDGKMIIIETEPKNGIVVEDGVMYYYVDDVRTYGGLIEIDGDYYYVNSQCIVVTGEYDVYKTNGLLPQGTYTFDESGRLIGEAVSD